jgi:hypothetical protein
MSGRVEEEVARNIQQYASHIPIPYGCLSVLALILGVVCSSLAIGIAILR